MAAVVISDDDGEPPTPRVPRHGPRVVPLRIDHLVVDGVSLRYAVRPGTASPPLLLFNGIGANFEIVQPLVDAMPEREVLIFDVPGIGGSDLDLIPRRLPGLARLALKFLDTLGYADPVDVAGVSWGGVLAQQFARTAGPRCRRLVLAATSAGAAMVPGKPSVLWKMATPSRYLSQEAMKRLAPDIYGGRVRQRPSLVAKHAARIIPPSFRGYMYQLFAALGWTSILWLHQLEQPTLIMAGDDDPIVPVVNARILAKLIPDATLHVVPGGGHLFMVVRAHEVGALVEEFLAEDAPSP
jgi:poly(3-hydroxyoctanoate) depolymerase